LAGAPGDFCDVAIGRTWRGRCPPDLDDPHLVGHSVTAQHHMVDAAVDAVNDDADPVAQLIGEFLANDPPGYRDRGCPAMEEDVFRATFLTPRGKRAIDGLDDVAAFTEFPQGRFEFV
jgi:hypothetical protein